MNTRRTFLQSLAALFGVGLAKKAEPKPGRICATEIRNLFEVGRAYRRDLRMDGMKIPVGNPWYGIDVHPHVFDGQHWHLVTKNDGTKA